MHNARETIECCECFVPLPEMFSCPRNYPIVPDLEQGGGQWRQENAVKCAEVAWDMHTHAPVLGEIDRAIAEGVESSEAFGEILYTYVSIVWISTVNSITYLQGVCMYVCVCFFFFFMSLSSIPTFCLCHEPRFKLHFTGSSFVLENDTRDIMHKKKTFSRANATMTTVTLTYFPRTVCFGVCQIQGICLPVSEG